MPNSAGSPGQREGGSGSLGFRDPALQQTFDDLGVVVAPLLDGARLSELVAAHAELSDPSDPALAVDYMRVDRSVMRRVSDAVRPVVEPALGEVLQGWRTAMVSFVAKQPGPDSEMFLHEDRTFVDERRARSMTVWIPLVDVGPSLPNGGLLVLPRSHLLPCGWSGSLTPDHIRPYEHVARPLMAPVDLRAGEAAFYDTRLLHASGPNTSAEPRVALVVALVPCEEPMLHVVATGRRRRELFSVDEDFFVEHRPREVEVTMPVRYRRREVLQDDSRLDPEAVASVLGLDTVPVPATVLPWDLRASDPVVPRGRFPLIGSFAELADDRLDRADLPEPTPVGGLEVDDPLAVAWSGPLAQLPELPTGWVDAAMRAELPSASCAAAAVLEPGARVHIRWDPGPGALGWWWVLHGPDVGAGFRTHERIASARSGECRVVGSSSQPLVWNDGPGRLVLVFGTLSETSSGRRRRSVTMRARSGW